MPRRLVITALLALAACADPGADPGPDPCAGDRCDGATSRAELIAELDGFTDPIAALLRERATATGTLTGSYRDIVDGIGEHLGCGNDTEASFVVLSNNDFIPKLIVTRCADDATAASRFFLALGSTDGHGGTDGQSIHMVAWDDGARRYRRYSTRRTEAGDMSVNVEPQFCLGCHGGPEGLHTWQPLMNEMTNPWSGWNAEPGFRSQLFDDYLDPGIAASPVYRELTDVMRSAADLEPMVRAGIDRVTNARIAGRDSAANVDEALALLRPVFCDETINYVSEIHNGGEIRTAAFIDPALPRLFIEAGVTESWQWLSADRVFLSVGIPALTLMPVRGESTIRAELALVTRGVLSAEQVLRVRAIDWRQPVASDRRCDLFRAVAERATAAAPTAADNTELIRVLYRDIMTDQPDVALASWGDELQAELDAAQAPGVRASLADRRRELACRLAQRFPTTPIFPDFDCP